MTLPGPGLVVWFAVAGAAVWAVPLTVTLVVAAALVVACIMASRIAQAAGT